MARSKTSRPLAVRDRLLILDKYIALEAHRRAAFVLRKGLSVQQLHQWARTYYGEGLRQLRRTLVGGA